MVQPLSRELSNIIKHHKFLLPGIYLRIVVFNVHYTMEILGVIKGYIHIYTESAT